MSEKIKKIEETQKTVEPEDLNFERIMLDAEAMDAARPEMNAIDTQKAQDMKEKFNSKINMVDAKLGKLVEYSLYTVSDEWLDAKAKGYTVRTGRSSEFDDFVNGIDILVGVEGADGKVAQFAIDTTWNKGKVTEKIQKQTNFRGGLPKGMTFLKYPNTAVTPGVTRMQEIPRFVTGLEKENAADFVHDVYAQEKNLRLPQAEQAYLLSVKNNTLEEMSLQAMGMKRAAENDPKTTDEMMKQITEIAKYLRFALAKNILEIEEYNERPSTDMPAGGISDDMHASIMKETSAYYGIPRDTARQMAEKQAEKIKEARGTKIGKKTMGAAELNN